MEQLFYESIYDALRELIRVLGGTKAVAARLWPEKTIGDAQNLLNDCLNPARPHRLNPEQVLWLLREGRQANCHAAMHFIADDCGYARPAPAEPADEFAELQRQFIAATGAQRALVERMERLTQSPLRTVK